MKSRRLSLLIPIKQKKNPNYNGIEVTKKNYFECLINNFDQSVY